ncbi:hypothetical protein BAC3_02162 [uncultured bacterium]|nr:hypothetical protein BAC3_02162 [uncultured bacterium]
MAKDIYFSKTYDSFSLYEGYHKFNCIIYKPYAIVWRRK